MSSNITAYPLCWPAGWPRHHGTRQKPNGSAKCGFVYARDRITTEIQRMRAEAPVLSTNCELLLNGQPRGDRPVSDPGVAIYFRLNGKLMVMATNHFVFVSSNIWRLSMALAYLRGLERHGGGTMLERAFAGFAALPAPPVDVWRRVLRFTDEDRPTAADIEARYRSMAMEHHPDRGGSTEAMAALNAARDDAMRSVAS